MRKLGTILALSVLAVAVDVRPAEAMIQFQRVFIDKYVKEHENKEFAKFIMDLKTTEKCLICHQGKKKTHHNPYGVHLVELLDRKKDLRNKKKINAALEKVAKMHVDPKDEKSPTYGELIAAGKLPGGTLEEAKKEPKEEKAK